MLAPPALRQTGSASQNTRVSTEAGVYIGGFLEESHLWEERDYVLKEGALTAYPFYSPPNDPSENVLTTPLLMAAAALSAVVLLNWMSGS